MTSKTAHASKEKRRAPIIYSPQVRDYLFGPPKRIAQYDNPRKQNTIAGPHEAIISELESKYNTLPASVISSTQIRKRVTYISSHLLPSEDDHYSYNNNNNNNNNNEQQRLALLYARPADVPKLITVVEQCKRLLKEQGKQVYQYNQLFELPPEEKEEEVVDETVLPAASGVGQQESDDEDEDDCFEAMEDRFKNAVMPPSDKKVVKSMRIFLATESVPELKAKEDVTVQVFDK